MDQRQRVLIVGAGVGALLIASGIWWLSRASPPPIAAQPTATPMAVVPPQPPTFSSTAAAAVPPAPASVATQHPASATRQGVQRRLDALAEAYERGDARAVERSMWPNHAVIRPDGELLDRRMVLAVWAEEWEASKNRDLKFYVEDAIEHGGKATVVWTILLTADVTDGNGDAHQMMVHGKQQATIVGSGDAEMLEGPIEYTTFERTIDGNAWPLD